jgi:hypothetical protein
MPSELDNSLLPLTPIRKSNVLIAGTGRNVAITIANEVHQLRSACKNFQSVQILIIESDSSDVTVNVLKRLETTIKGFKFITLGALDKKIPKRVERIAYCRNQIVNAVRSDPTYANIDFIAMADLDGLNTLLNAEQIEHCWSSTQAWDVVTANQLDFYYDVYALRHRHWSPVNCQVQQEQLEPIIGCDPSVNLAVWAKQVQLKPENRFIEVESAFGGFAIYKKEAFIAGNYEGNEDGVEVCEHVPFHRALRKAGYRIFIHCGLVNCKRPAEAFNARINKSSRFFLGIVHRIGVNIFGKKRLKKYLNQLADLC